MTVYVDADACPVTRIAERIAKDHGIAMREKPDLIILQSRSPSCGVKEIYDGTFSRKLISGRGVFAELAVQAGFLVANMEDVLKDNTYIS